MVKAPALLRRPARYLNHGVPDQERLLARRGISLVGSVKSAALVEVTSNAERGWTRPRRPRGRAVAVARWRATSACATRNRPAVATAILIGDRGSLDPDVERRLQEAGTYHVIAISGGNIAILAGLVLWLLRLAARARAGAAGAAIAVLAAYAFIAGGGPSVVRATVMAAIYLSLRMIDQRTSPVHAMALTAAALLVVSPLAIADVGFWLTFGATAAIVVGAIARAAAVSRLVAGAGRRWCWLGVRRSGAGAGGRHGVPAGHARRAGAQPGGGAVHGAGAGGARWPRPRRTPSAPDRSRRPPAG